MKETSTKIGTQNPPKATTALANPFFQPKLTVNTPSDTYEQEADAMANRVMWMPEGNAPFFAPISKINNVQRKCATCEEDEKVQRKPLVQREETPPTTPAVPTSLSMRGGGTGTNRRSPLSLSPSFWAASQPNSFTPLGTGAPPIDWLGIRTELTLRRADHLMPSIEDDVTNFWSYGYRQYRTLGLPHDLATKAMNLSINTAVGSFISRDYPTIAENFERTLPPGGFRTPIIPFLSGTFDLSGGSTTGSSFGQSLWRKEVPSNTTDPSGQTAPPEVAQTLSASNGQPLDTNTQQFMGSRFGHDFSQVRVKTDAQAASSAQAIQAKAYTSGTDIVFGSGEYQPNTTEGKRLLAHELTHVVQQGGGQEGVQRVDFGPTSTAPTTWAASVTAATTSTDKTALIQSVIGSTITVVDVTSVSASDTSPTPSHLVPYTTASKRINYDDGLITKTAAAGGRSLRTNAGYTLHSGGNDYVILSSLSLQGNDYYETLVTLNHEFDHIRQHTAGSTLTGNLSELDAWTTTFIREFHHTYLLRDNGTTCFVQSVSQFAPLLMYFKLISDAAALTNTAAPANAAALTAAVNRIKAYYLATLASHSAHDKVFKFWIHRTMTRSSNPQLAQRLDSELSLATSTGRDLTPTRQFPCTGLTALSYSAPVLSVP